jgi:predicted ATPase
MKNKNHLTSFGVNNFKVFKDFTSLDLKPITILTGTNSSGKSSFNQALKLFQTNKNNILTNQYPINLEFKNESSSLANYVNVVSDNDKSRDISFEIPFSLFSMNHFKLRYEFQPDEESSFGDAKLSAIKLSHNNKFLYEVGPITSEEYEDAIESLHDHIPAPLVSARMDRLKFADTIFDIYEKIVEAIRVYLMLCSKIDIEKEKEIFKNINDHAFLSNLDEDVLELVNKIVEYRKYITIEHNEIVYDDGVPDYKYYNSYGSGGIIKFENRSIIDRTKKGDQEYLSQSFNPSRLLYDYSFEFSQDDRLKLREKELDILFRLPHLSFYDFEVNSDFYKYFMPDKDDPNLAQLSTFISEVLNFEIPKLQIKESGNQRLFKRILNDFQSKVSNISNIIEFEYIPSVRNLPNSSLTRSNKTYLESSINELFRNTPSTGQTAFLKKWLNSFGIADDIELTNIGNSGNFEFLLINGQKKIPLSTVGYGVGQVLPIILQLALSKKKQFVIEEPETNLHPALQSKLAEMFVDAQLTFAYQLIIETHSEYLIRKLQYLIGKGTYKASNTSLYYFYHPDNVPLGEHQVKKIGISENGLLLESFGKGFLDESDSIAMDLYQITKGQNN